jgi:hypothetical protein
MEDKKTKAGKQLEKVLKTIVIRRSFQVSNPLKK